MESLFQQLEDWLRELLVSGIMTNLTNAFDKVNSEVGQIATDVAQTPAGFLPVRSPWIWARMPKRIPPPWSRWSYTARTSPAPWLPP
mgnify:CR=1 FL=1